MRLHGGLDLIDVRSRQATCGMKGQNAGTVPREDAIQHERVDLEVLRDAFPLQRALANELAFPESNPGKPPVPQLVTARQCIEMAAIAGAAGSGLLDKIGTLTPGKEADIVVLDANTITIAPGT